MRIQIVENCYAPRPIPGPGVQKPHAPSILDRGTFVDLPDADAKALIDKGFAIEVSDDAEAPKKKAKKSSDDAE